MWALSILAFRLNIIVYAGMSLDICLNDIKKQKRLNKPDNASKSSYNCTILHWILMHLK